MTARGVEDAEHVGLLGRVLDHHAAYLSAVRRVFVAVDRGQHARARAIDEREGDPQFERAEELVQEEAAEHRSEALAALRRLDRVEAIVLWGTPVAFGIGLCLLAFFTSLLVRAVRRNEHLALHDPLTGLPNRTLFRDRVQQAVRLAERHATPLTVMVVDLDRFKEVNDTLGHATGDRLLCALGPRLRGALRASDTVARMGGDEFALLLPDMDAAGAQAVGEGLRRVLEEPFQLPGLTAATEASVGIAHFPLHGRDADILLQRAEIAMYEAKEQHTGVATYAPERDPYDPRRLALGGELRLAVSEDEFVLHYQPKVDLRTDAVAGVEALVRWMHPERGLLAPGEFIPLAEHTGLMRPLTLWVLESALGQCRRWLDRDRELAVSVNLAVPSLLDADFVTDVARLLAKQRVPARLLGLEITEGSMMTDPVRAVRVLELLDEMGIALSVDDFGTGYSSLAYLGRLPVHELKIDKAFVLQVESRPDDELIVRSTIELGHNLGLRVVAEGVESSEVLERLRAWGCDIAQGFFLGRPLAATDLDGWLHGRGAAADRPRRTGSRAR